MTQNPEDPHRVDVNVRARILDAARARLKLVRQEEARNYGVSQTTMADVARGILLNWEPQLTNPTTDEDGVARDPSGARVTERGHRRFARPEEPIIPARGKRATDKSRARQVLQALREAVTAETTQGILLLNEAKRVIRRENLGDIEVDGRTLEKHWQHVKRTLRQPLRFTMAERIYQQRVAQLELHQTTITRALEVGLTAFAKTGQY